MIKDVHGRLDYYIISLKIKQTLLHWWCELVESVLLLFFYFFFFSFFFGHIKMSYYWFNRQELLQKAQGRYRNCRFKEKAAKYYIANKDALKETAKNKYRNLSEEEKEVKR